MCVLFSYLHNVSNGRYLRGRMTTLVSHTTGSDSWGCQSISCISIRVFNIDKLDPGDAFNHLPLTLKTLVKVELNCLSERYPIFSENLEKMETANSVVSEHLVNQSSTQTLMDQDLNTIEEELYENHLIVSINDI